MRPLGWYLRCHVVPYLVVNTHAHLRAHTHKQTRAYLVGVASSSNSFCGPSSNGTWGRAHSRTPLSSAQPSGAYPRSPSSTLNHQSTSGNLDRCAEVCAGLRGCFCACMCVLVCVYVRMCVIVQQGCQYRGETQSWQRITGRGKRGRGEKNEDYIGSENLSPHELRITGHCSRFAPWATIKASFD